MNNKSFILPALLLLAGFAFHASAADNPRCIEQFKAEEARIMADFGRAVSANPPGSDIKAQQQAMRPVHDALKAAGARAEQCNRDSRPPQSADSKLRMKQCTDRAEQEVEEMRRRQAGRASPSRNEQVALRNEEDRISEARMKCLQAAK